MYHASAVRERCKGDSWALVDKWMIPFETGEMPLTRQSVLSNLQQAVLEFNSLALREERLPRVGIVGEIYVKYNTFVNNDIVQWLMDQESGGGNAALARLLLGIVRRSQSRRASPSQAAGFYLFSGLECTRSSAILRGPGRDYSAWFPFLSRSPLHYGGCPNSAVSIVHLTHQYGEGWLLSGEIGEFVKSGVQNVLCLQPFGCIANHVIAKGVAKRLNETYPEMNLLFLDVDPGGSEVNFVNRAHFFVEQAKATLG